MKIKNYPNKIVPILGGLAVSLFSGCNLFSEDCPNKQNPNNRTQNISCLIREDFRDYDQITWIFGKDKQTYGYEVNKTNPKSLEEVAFTDKQPLGRELTEWEMPSLARLIPLKKTIEKNASYYGINPMWGTMFLTLESCLDPSDINKFSNDYGLGQIKKESEALAKAWGTDPKNPFYNPALDKNKSIFDPETNITMGMMLHRYNIERFHLKNSDQAYAIYFRGEPGLNPDGSLSDLTKNQLDAFRERQNYYAEIIPLFKLKKDELVKIKNKDARVLMEIYHQNLSIPDTYRAELDYFLNDLETQIKENRLEANARSVLVYDDCLVFAKAIGTITGEKPRDYYARLLTVGNRLSETVKNLDLANRVLRTNTSLMEAER